MTSGIIKWVASHHTSTMQIGRQHEGFIFNPIDEKHSFTLKLTILTPIHELIWEVTIEIFVMSVWTSLYSSAVSFISCCKPIWVHCGHNENVGTVNNTSHTLIVTVFLQQELSKIDQDLTTDYFIAMHIANVFEHRFAWLFLVNFIRDLDCPQCPVLNALANAVKFGQSWKLCH